MKKIIGLLLIFFIFLVFPFKVNAEERVINIHLFYGETCPHCAKEEAFLDEYLEGKDLPGIVALSDK